MEDRDYHTRERITGQKGICNVSVPVLSHSPVIRAAAKTLSVHRKESHREVDWIPHYSGRNGRPAALSRLVR